MSISRLGCPSSRTTVSSVKPRNLREPPLDLERLVLQHIQIRAVNLHGQRAFQSRQRFVHRIFGRLRVIEDHAGEGLELLLKIGSVNSALL